MQDRFKYRAKRVDNNKFVCGYLCFIYIDNKSKCSIYNPNDASSYDCCTETIGQCIGLRDKNGKLVYFDDLVKLPTGLIGKVTQILDENSADYGKIIIKDIEKPHNVAAHWYTSSLSIKDSEIIGNIYENKELLKETEQC